ncbi:proline-rich protein 2-like [Phoca vitulina]|uniref:proline-rich protein 2-like n=1 Tax=Phoca vitulina TaxID=9720 RepID=UPI001395EF17|nr:proline-rich protein 2-like [Phoca vitulina]
MDTPLTIAQFGHAHWSLSAPGPRPARAKRSAPRRSPAPGGRPARRALLSPPSGRGVSPREPGGGGGTAQASPRLRPAPPPPAPRPAGPPPPRRAQLRRSSHLCNVSSRSGGDASGSGWGPAVAASAARRARTARARGHLAASGALRAVLRAPARRSDSRPAPLRPRTKDRGHRAPGAAPRDRPGDGQPRRVRCTPALAGRPEPEPERAPSYDSGDTAAGERACCPLGCATAAGAGGGPCRAPLSARPSPPPRAPRAPARGLRGQEPRGAPRRRRA